MKITAVIMYWYPYVGATQPIYKAIFEHLAQVGHDMNIIAGIPHYRKGRKELWREYKGVFYRKSLENGICVRRTFVLSPKLSFGFDGNGIIRRLMNYSSFFLSALVTSIFCDKPKPDIMFFPTFPPILGGILACWISFFKRKPFIYNVQDVHPDLLYSMKLFRFKPVSFLLEKSERHVYSRARHITAISRTIKETLIKKGVPYEKITVIPNFCDTDVICPGPKDNDFSREFGLTDKFVVMFAGNIGQPQGVEFILKAASGLRDYPEILVVFVGRGERKEHAKESALKMNLSNVSFIPLQEVERMNHVWASADICLVSLRKNISHLAFPSKIFGILSSGRPLLAMVDRGSEIWKFTEKSGAGICVEAEDSAALAEKIIMMFKNESLRKQMGINGRQHVEKNFSRELVVNSYRELFEKITGKHQDIQ